MNEIEIKLQDVNPREFFGDQNSNVEQLRSYFPKLKIVARGSILKAFGEEAVLDEFEMRTEMLIAHFVKYNKLDQPILESILTADPSTGIETMDDKDSFILHGVGGRSIKAKTITQQRLVQLSKKNDMLFAVGPAGTGKTYTSVALAVKALKEKQVK